MTVFAWAMGIVGGGLIALAFAMLSRQVEQLTHHVNRLLEAEDQPPRRVNLSIGEGVLRSVIRRELQANERRQQQEQGRN